jgi:hypothetical protein
MKRAVLARLDLGRDELVVSADEHGNVDVRLHTETAGLRFPSKHGITFPRERLGDLIAVLKAGAQQEGSSVMKHIVGNEFVGEVSKQARRGPPPLGLGREARP